MNVTIIGAGNMARGIATRLVAGGHSVALVGKDREKAEALAADLRKGQAGAKVAVADLDRALANPVIVLATPYAAAKEFAVANAGRLAGKIVVDITNPLNATYSGLATPPGISAAEEIAAFAPGARVVKAFNTVFAGPLAKGVQGGKPLQVLVAGDDAAAKATVIGLVTDGCLAAIDAGPLARARELEGVALLGITLQGTLGTGYQSAWQIAA